jgi:hypothetical protein
MGTEYPSVRIVVTGSRNWNDYRKVSWALRRELTTHGEFLLGVGDCPAGADQMALHWGRQNLMWPVLTFHAPWDMRGVVGGPVRNHFMIDMFRPRLVLAFLRPESRGTVDCVGYAESKGIEIRRFYEGGEDGPVA